MKLTPLRILLAVVLALLLAFTLRVCAGIAGSMKAEKNISILLGRDAITLRNRNSGGWTDCDWDLNGRFSAHNAIRPSADTIVGMETFARSDGLLFSPLFGRARTLHVHCRKPSTLSLYQRF